MKKMLFVFNPRSGKEQIKGQLMEILDIFTKAGYELRVHVDVYKRQAYEVNNAIHIMQEADEHIIINVLRTQQFVGRFYRAPLE